MREAKVIVLDDSRTVTLSIHEFLKDIVTIKEYNLADDFLNDIRVNSYELIMIDINLPEKNGLDLVNEFKDYPTLKDSKIVVISAEQSSEYKRLAKELGVSAYIKKPFKKQTLQNTVKMLLRGG